MSAQYRYYPLPRPSLKTERSSRNTCVCSCNPQCGGDICKGSDPSRNPSSSADASTAIPSSMSSSSNACYPPQPPSPHVHFLGLYKTYALDYDYDRSSTVVMPNECALPARGCPGRTYFSTTMAHVARTGRRLTRCATPGGSRANSRTRNNNMSPPPSPSFYAKHIFYPDEYPFPSPSPSPRVVAPPLTPDTCMALHASDDSDQGLSTPPEAAFLAPSPPSLSRRGSSGYPPSYPGSQLFIDAPGHPPIPGHMSGSSHPRHYGAGSGGGSADMFAIANALNGLELHNTDVPAWSLPSSATSSTSHHSSKRSESGSSPKKVKSKKSKSSLSGGEAPKRVRIAPSGWTNDAGALGGF